MRICFHNTFVILIIMMVASCKSKPQEITYHDLNIKNFRNYLKGRWALSDTLNHQEIQRWIYRFSFKTDSSGILEELTPIGDKRLTVASCPSFFTISERNEVLYLKLHTMFADHKYQPSIIQKVTSERLVTLTANNKIETYLRLAN